LQIDELLQEIIGKYDVPVRRIGAKADRADFVDESLTGKYFDNDRYISFGENISIANIYRNCYERIKEEIRTLVLERGIHHVLVIFCGYTSYGLWGLKKALKEMNNELTEKVTANAIIQDSSF